MPPIVNALQSPDVVSKIGAFVYAILIFTAAVRIATTPQERWLSIAIISLGGALGWLFGELLSPYNPKEGQQFAQYAGAVAVFVTGYAAGKIDALVNAVLKPETIQNLTALKAFRVIALITAMLVSMLTTYASRSYADFTHARGVAVSGDSTTSAGATKLRSSDTSTRAPAVNSPRSQSSAPEKSSQPQE